MSDTNFIESNALLAVVAGDLPEAAGIIAQMLPGERRRLKNAAVELANLIDIEERERARFDDWLP